MPVFQSGAPMLTNTISSGRRPRAARSRAFSSGERGLKCRVSTPCGTTRTRDDGKPCSTIRFHDHSDGVTMISSERSSSALRSATDAKLCGPKPPSVTAKTIDRSTAGRRDGSRPRSGDEIR